MNLPLILDNLTNEAYHHGAEFAEYFSSSQIKNYLVSPKYARYTWLNHELKTSDALTFGSVYHDLLESRVNHTPINYIVFHAPINQKTGNPYGDGTQAYEIAKAEFIALNVGKNVCTAEQMETAIEMVNQLLTGDANLSPVVQQFIHNGKAEQSHFVEYQGGKFKFRTDLKTKNCIIDWKTTSLENPKPENFERQIVDFGYHISAAMYQFLDHELTGRWRKFFWIVQEKQPPYDFTIIDAARWAWDVNTVNGQQVIEAGPGAILFMKLLETHLICLERNEWPGYSSFTMPDWKGRRIATPEPPAWYKNRIINFYL